MSLILEHNDINGYWENYELATAVLDLNGIRLDSAIDHSSDIKISLTWDQVNYKQNTDNFFWQSKIYLVYSYKITGI